MSFMNQADDTFNKLTRKLISKRREDWKLVEEDDSSAIPTRNYLTKLRDLTIIIGPQVAASPEHYSLLVKDSEKRLLVSYSQDQQAIKELYDSIRSGEAAWKREGLERLKKILDEE
jgi:hypothetical protein